MTSKKEVVEPVQSIIAFMNQFEQLLDASTTNSLFDQYLAKVKSMVKEPEYEHGTLVAQICGVETARKLHKGTQEYSEALGCVFDYKSGH